MSLKKETKVQRHSLSGKEYTSAIRGEKVSSNELKGLLKDGYEMVEVFGIRDTDLSAPGKIDDLTKFLAKQMQLRHVFIKDCSLDKCSDEAFAKLMQALSKPNLESLDLTGNLMISQDPKEPNSRCDKLSALINKVSFHESRKRDDVPLTINLLDCGIDNLDAKNDIVRKGTVRRKPSHTLEVAESSGNSESTVDVEQSKVTIIFDRSAKPSLLVYDVEAEKYVEDKTKDNSSEHS